MPYVDLGSRGPVLGQADSTGRNPGKWTVTFDPVLLNIFQPQFEIYKLIVSGAAPSATFSVYRDLALWDAAVYAALNSWDPVNPLLLRPGQSVYFFYSSLASDGNQPSITAHLRYDPSLHQLYGAV